MKRLIVACLLVACGGSTATRQVHPVEARAPFDLGCPAAQTRYLQIDDKTVGAEGCGKRATYVKVCRRTGLHGWGEECQWVANLVSGS